MHKFRRITAFFNIEPNEERLIGLLILLYFILALGFVFVQSMAFGVFLAEYGPPGLPYSYIANAIFASLAAVFYIKLGERVSFSTLLMLNLAFLGTCCFLAWLGLKTRFAHELSFLLPLLFQIVANLGNLAVWTLAGRIFNVQQAKRLFPLLGIGLWLGNILGGLLVVPLVEWIGSINLLLSAVVSMGLGLLVLRMITNTYLREAVSTSQTPRTVSIAKRPSGLLRNRYVLLIFSYVTLWWMAFFFLDNIFSDRAAARFPDVNQLTIFMGQLLSVTGIVALIFSTFLAGRIIGRFGLRAGLISEVLIVTFILALLAISSSLRGDLTVVFILAALAKLVTVALGFSLSQSAYAILFQPLPNTLRGRAQATADGIFQPIASGIAGISLLALTTGLNFNYLGLSYAYLVLAMGLLIVILLLSGRYVHALTQAITKRRLGESPLAPADPASISLLQSRLYDPHPAVALYALNKLDTLDSRTVVTALPRLIQHPAPEVRREAFSRIEGLKLRTMLEAVHNQLILETEPAVKEADLRALGAIADADSCAPLLNALLETDKYSLRGALIGLLKYQESSTAEESLHRLIDSAEADDRVLAAQVLGEADRTKFGQMHKILLRDSNPAVRREAIQSVAKSRQPLLYPLLIEACDAPETSHAAALALIAIGIDILPEVKAAFSQPTAPCQRLLTLTRVMGRIGGVHTHILLPSRINTSDGELRSQILNTLSECGYHTNNQSEIHATIKMEVQRAAWVCAVQADLGNANETALLSAAFRQFITQTRDRILLLLSFEFDKEAMLRVRDALHSGSTSQLAYALEIIDTQLPSDWKPMIMPLLEDLSPPERLQRLTLIFPQSRQTSDERLQTLIEAAGRELFTDWVRACAIHAAVQLNAQSTYDLIRGATTDSSLLICDTARWALARFSTEQQEGKNAMLSTIEKVLILKTVNVFSQTPDDVLADVANLLEEMDVSENETIFRKGEPGDSMYVIVDGKVRVHTEERLLNYLGESDVFGEMALLDPEPRLASVTAVEPTRLFRLDQSPFYQLMAERPEVATGIIRVLTRLLRARVQDVSQLDGRVKELERRLNGNESESA